MAQDPNPGPTRTETAGGSRSGRVPDASAAGLFAALQSRAGHAVVIGDDAATAETFFERVDAQLVCQRRLRLAGTGLDPESMTVALGEDIRGPHRPRSAEAILSMVATEARAAGLPILVEITGAEEAGAAALERLGALIDSVPDARAAVRLVLLGGPRLEEVLAQPEAQKVAARILTTMRVPSRGAGRWEFPLPTPRWQSSWRETAQWVGGGLVALVGVIMLLTPWTGRDGVAPTPMDAAMHDAAPTGVTVPADVAKPTDAAAPAADAEPPAVVEAPPVAEEPRLVEPPGMPVPPAAPESPATREPPVAAAPAPAEAPPAGAERPPPVTAPRRHAPSLGRSLQVGAFRDAENARALAATLSARFPDVNIVTVTLKGVLFHCVRLGGFADEYALAARADALRAAGYPVVRAPE